MTLQAAVNAALDLFADLVELLGVLDIDSPDAGRFDAVDAAGLDGLAQVFLAACDSTRG